MTPFAAAHLLIRHLQKTDSLMRLTAEVCVDSFCQIERGSAIRLIDRAGRCFAGRNLARNSLNRLN